MSEIHVSVTDQVLKVVKSPIVASGGLNEVSIVFAFCELWNGFVKTAFFYREGEDKIPVILDENDTCILPSEVTAENGTFHFFVVGVNGATRRTSTNVKYKVVKGAVISEDYPEIPTKAIYDSVIVMLNDTSNSVEMFLASAEKTLDDANVATEKALDAISEANNARDSANEAAQYGREIADDLVNKRDSGYFKGEKGDSGEALIDDTTVGSFAWSSKNTVDKLCPSFTERGAIVTCNPVEGYPLEVVTHIEGNDIGALTLYHTVKNHINVQGREIAGSGNFEATTKRPMHENLLYKGVSNSNYYNPAVITDLTMTESGASFTSTFGAYGIGYALPVMPDVYYTVSGEVVNAAISLSFYQADGTFILARTEGNNKITAKSPVNAAWCLVVVGAKASGDVSVNNLQVEFGTNATQYEQGKFEKITIELAESNLGGSYNWATGITQQPVAAFPGVNLLWSSNGETEVTGRADPNAIINDLYNKVNTLSATMTALTGV